MLSPYSNELDPLRHRTIYEPEEQLITKGYEFLGWANNGAFDNLKYKDCINDAHNYYSAFPGAWNSIQHTPSGSDVTQWCTLCKIYWKVDMSG